MSPLSENDSVNSTFHHLYHQDASLFFASSSFEIQVALKSLVLFFDIKLRNVPIHLFVIFLGYSASACPWPCQTIASKVGCYIGSDCTMENLVLCYLVLEVAG